jgi:hypothetical protein
MSRAVYSSRSIGDSAEGNMPAVAPAFAERAASSGSRCSERRISLQDYSFAFVLADLAAILGSGILLSHILLPEPQASAGWASPCVLLMSFFYVLASIAFKSYSSSIVLNLRETMRRVFSAFGVSFGLFLIPGEMYNFGCDYLRPHFFFAPSPALS